ncbi:DNA adenine methylase [Conexibacter sp. S30A1]|uniref:DNA adenine methylase n=1 Tax=Conexibacter sp. S30A1 TaxID=2937800 RepID=UPI00200FA5E7|nr:DNA adenine methylase [Conexibacter sp. S30A1]
MTTLKAPPPNAAAPVPAAVQGLPGVADAAGSAIGATERGWQAEVSEIEHPLAHSRYQSPLRYAGAKSSLSPVLARVLLAAKQSREVRSIRLLVEPFAGGASASLRLVGDGVVDRILLADADPLVAAFWQVAAADSGRLIDRMRGEWSRYVSHGGSRAVARWDHWRSWTPPRHMVAKERRLSSAVRCLFLNRTTFSGILHGRAGPIGGRSQQTPYDIGCRWNPDAVEERIAFIGYLYGTGRLVDVWCKDWRATLDDVPELYPQLLPSNVVAYLDPPYIDKSALLYRISFDPAGGYRARASAADSADLHLQLASYLRRKAQFRWLLSYDAHESLTTSRALYRATRMNPSRIDQLQLGVRRWTISKRLVATRYSAGGRTGKRAAEELLLTTLPASSIPTDDGLRPIAPPGERDHAADNADRTSFSGSSPNA